MTETQQTKHDGLLCPTCRIDLVMSDRQGIEIDYCPKCRGVWLDRGELDKIIERSAREAAPASAPETSATGFLPQPGFSPQAGGPGPWGAAPPSAQAPAGYPSNPGYPPQGGHGGYENQGGGHGSRGSHGGGGSHGRGSHGGNRGFLGRLFD